MTATMALSLSIIICHLLFLSRTAVDHIGGKTLSNLFVTRLAYRFEFYPTTLFIDLDDFGGSHDRVSDVHWCLELDLLINIDGARPWQTRSQNSRDQGGAEHAMNNTLLERCGSGVLHVDMHGIVITTDTGEEHDICFSNRLRVERFHSNCQVFQVVTV